MIFSQVAMELHDLKTRLDHIFEVLATSDSSPCAVISEPLAERLWSRSAELETQLNSLSDRLIVFDLEVLEDYANENHIAHDSIAAN